MIGEFAYLDFLPEYGDTLHLARLRDHYNRALRELEEAQKTLNEVRDEIKEKVESLWSDVEIATARQEMAFHQRVAVQEEFKAIKEMSVAGCPSCGRKKEEKFDG